jgi:hypothetical protein
MSVSSYLVIFVYTANSFFPLFKSSHYKSNFSSQLKSSLFLCIRTKHSKTNGFFYLSQLYLFSNCPPDRSSDSRSFRATYFQLRALFSLRWDYSTQYQLSYFVLSCSALHCGTRLSKDPSRDPKKI